MSEQENNTEDNAGDTGVAADTAPAAPVVALLERERAPCELVAPS